MSILDDNATYPPALPVAVKIRFKTPADCPLALAGCSAIASYEAELEKNKFTEAKLRKLINRERTFLRQKNLLIQQKDTLSKESEHRFLNGLQLVTSLLTLQSRSTNNPEAAAQLTIAANRVDAVGRVHRHLHTLDHLQSVDFKQYLESLCYDLSSMTSTSALENAISVVGGALQLPSETAIPMGFIASELITNAIKYAKGKIAVTLRETAKGGYSLAVANDGPGLPEGFDPAATRGLGMKIITSLVRQIGGSLTIGKNDNGKGTQFTVAVSKR
jgi:two-component sensor histidine kinase